VGTTEIRNAAGEPVAFGSATFYILNVRSPGDTPGIMVATTGRSKPKATSILKGES
jgi:hypothetical protein